MTDPPTSTSPVVVMSAGRSSPSGSETFARSPAPGVLWPWELSGSASGRTGPGNVVAKALAYRDAFQKRRCAVPADGFFEWVGQKDARRPIWFHRPDGGVFFFAGLYESWRSGRACSP